MQMTSEPMRDPVTDHLLTPRNSALVVIDYQPLQLKVMTSMDREVLVDNIVSVARLARTYDLPVVLSTVNAAEGQGNTLPEIKAALPDTPEIDRTTMNAWEDVEFRQAVEATGRKKLIMTALWTEICLAMPVIHSMADGYDVFAVTDASGGVSREAHDMAVLRMAQAGAAPITWLAVASEWQRDWAREATLAGIAEVVSAHGGGSGVAFAWEQQLLHAASE